MKQHFTDKFEKKYLSIYLQGKSSTSKLINSLLNEFDSWVKNKKNGIFNLLGF